MEHKSTLRGLWSLITANFYEMGREIPKAIMKNLNYIVLIRNFIFKRNNIFVH